MTDLIRDVDLAEQFGIDVTRLHRLRREKGWPCVKFSRTDYRFTPSQVEEIVSLQTITKKATKKGLTKGSAARGRA